MLHYLGYLLAILLGVCLCVQYVTATPNSWMVTSSVPLKFSARLKSQVLRASYSEGSSSSRAQKQQSTATTIKPLFYVYRLKYNETSLRTEFQVKKEIMAGAVMHGQAAVVTVEENFKLTHQATLISTPSWALDRINQPTNALDGKFSWHPKINGSGVDVYIVDTGVYQHSSFLQPISYDFDAYASPPARLFSNRHGTHVAGLVASSLYGVAPGATIHSITVLDSDGSGYLDDVTAGLEWIYENAPERPCIISMSLGANQYSSSMAAVINALVNRRHIVLAAAGNDFGADACRTFPAQLSTVLAVGSTTRSDYKADFTNIGSCVNLYSPGHTILSCSTTFTGSLNMSGTSMSTPLVAGAVALIIQAQQDYPKMMPYGHDFPIRSILMQYFVTTVGFPFLYVNFDNIYQVTTMPPPQSPPPPPPPPPSPLPHVSPILVSTPPVKKKNSSGSLTELFSYGLLAVCIYIVLF